MYGIDSTGAELVYTNFSATKLQRAGLKNTSFTDIVLGTAEVNAVEFNSAKMNSLDYSMDFNYLVKSKPKCFPTK